MNMGEWVNERINSVNNCEMIGISFSSTIMGITLGFYFAFIPTLDKGKQD
jgi:hypothetical protein